MLQSLFGAGLFAILGIVMAAISGPGRAAS